MEYGKLQGEIAAAGKVAGASGTASLVGHPFNTVGVSQISLGLFAVTLKDGVDPDDCAVLASPTANNTVAVGGNLNDTDTVKIFAVETDAGTLIANGFHYAV